LILSLQTTTFSAFGGIPTYNRLVCRVLNEIAAQRQAHILIGTDKAADLETSHSEFPNLDREAFDQNRTAFIRRFIHLATTRRIDLALIGHVNYAPLARVLKLVQPRMRYGVMLYGIEAWEQLPLLKRHALQHADFMISISEYTKQKAIDANRLNPERIHLLPNALEWTDTGAEPEPTQPAQPPGTRILSVCRLDRTEQYKGVDKVIEALPQVAERVPDVQYVVVGGGSDLPRHQELAERLGVAHRVHFLGYLADDVLRACYRDCDLFVMPSAGEGFGFVFLEAMKYGKAVIAANSGGAPEVVKDGKTGRLVEYGDKEALVGSLIDLCLDKDACRRLGHAGQLSLQERFTFTHFKHTLTKILLKELPAKVVGEFQLTDAPTVAGCPTRQLSLDEAELRNSQRL
jgi:glycosyltransferase involved in cell wall biosynthesis